MEVATKSLPMACSLCGNLSSRKDDHCQFLGDLIVDILKRYEDDWILVFLGNFLVIACMQLRAIETEINKYVI